MASSSDIEEAVANKVLIKSIVEKLLPIGSGTISDIFGRMGRRLALQYGIETRQDLKLLLENHPELFELYPRTAVRLTTNLSVCGDHIGGYCPGYCGALHLCHYHLLSGTCPRRDRKCRVGHVLTTPFNLSLLEVHGLDMLSFFQLRSIFRLPWVRRGVLRPRVCFHYNKHPGCAKGAQCTSLHLCGPYVSGGCKFGRRCFRNHNIFDEQIAHVFALFGIDTERRPSVILEELRFYETSQDDESGESNSRSALVATGLSAFDPPRFQNASGGYGSYASHPHGLSRGSWATSFNQGGTHTSYPHRFCQVPQFPPRVTRRSFTALPGSSHIHHIHSPARYN